LNRRLPLPRTPGIGRAELEILNYIQDHQPATVRDVAEHFARTKGHVRTTVLNVMRRLVHKGYLTRAKVEGVYQYRPKSPKPQVLRRLVSEFVEKALEGSVSPFVAYLAEDAELSGQDLRELRKLVELLERQREGKS